MSDLTIDDFFEMVLRLSDEASPITDGRITSNTSIQYCYYYGVTLNIGLNLAECITYQNKLTGPVLVKLEVLPTTIVGKEIEYLRDVVAFAALAEATFAGKVFSYQP